MIAVWILPQGIYFLLTVNHPFLGLYLLSSLAHAYPSGVSGLALLFLRVSVGSLFMIHGHPKVLHLRQWANSITTPVFLCLLSAWTMLGAGLFLILGFFILLATLSILVSMLFAIVLHLIESKPFMAKDPYLIPED